MELVIFFCVSVFALCERKNRNTDNLVGAGSRAPGCQHPTRKVLRDFAPPAPHFRESLLLRLAKIHHRAHFDRAGARARTLGLHLQEHVDSGLVRFQQIDPAELSPGEFAANVRKSVEADNARLVIIDSLNGYLAAMPDERFLILQMHELLSYLGQQGVLTILVLAQHGLVGPMDTPLDISYLSDSVVMLRYFEVGGTVRRALSVVKKRSGRHEHTIREFRLSSAGITLGPPLREFSGIFSGNPHYTGAPKPEGSVE